MPLKLKPITIPATVVGSPAVESTEIVRRRPKAIAVLALLVAALLGLGWLFLWRTANPTGDLVPPFARIDCYPESAAMFAHRFDESGEAPDTAFSGLIFKIEVASNSWKDSVEIDGDGRKFISLPREKD